MVNRALKISATTVIDRWSWGRFGSKATKKYNKQAVRSQRRLLEKREAYRQANE